MKFIVNVPVKKVSGWQQFGVEANCKAEALETVKRGGGEFLEEELAVDSLDMKKAIAYEQ